MWHSRSPFIRFWSGSRMSHIFGGRARWEVTQQEGIKTYIALTIEIKGTLPRVVHGI